MKIYEIQARLKLNYHQAKTFQEQCEQLGLFDNVSKRPAFTLEEITEAIKAHWVKEFGKLMDDDSERDGYFICGFVHEALKAAAGTATCGVDDDGWHCQKTTEPGDVASQCMNGCTMKGDSCEG